VYLYSGSKEAFCRFQGPLIAGLLFNRIEAMPILQLRRLCRAGRLTKTQKTLPDFSTSSVLLERTSENNILWPNILCSTLMCFMLSYNDHIVRVPLNVVDHFPYSCCLPRQIHPLGQTVALPGRRGQTGSFVSNVSAEMLSNKLGINVCIDRVQYWEIECTNGNRMGQFHDFYKQSRS
jgi:hypothetical protein